VPLTEPNPWQPMTRTDIVSTPPPEVSNPTVRRPRRRTTGRRNIAVEPLLAADDVAIHFPPRLPLASSVRKPPQLAVGVESLATAIDASKCTNCLQQGCPDEVIFLRLPRVKAITGLSKSSLYELIRANRFPAPVQLGPRIVAWATSEVRQWAAERILTSRSSGPNLGSKRMRQGPLGQAWASTKKWA
jgi:prophage regulatory protein